MHEVEHEFSILYHSPEECGYPQDGNYGGVVATCNQYRNREKSSENVLQRMVINLVSLHSLMEGTMRKLSMSEKGRIWDKRGP